MNILLLGEASYVEEMQAKIKETPHRVVAIGTSIPQAAEFLKTVGYDAVFVGFDINDAVALLEGYEPPKDVKVWVSSDEVTLPTWRKITAIGAIPVVRGTEMEFLNHYRPTGSRTALISTEDHASPIRSSKVGVLKKRIIAVYSSKGGVGKTTIAMTLAATMAEQANLKTCIIDLDNTREGSDIARKFGYFLISERTPNSVITNWASFPDQKFRSWELVMEYLTSTNISNLYFLSAPWNVEDEKFLTPELVDKVVNILKQHMDIIIFDMSDDIRPSNLKALEMSDLILYVATPDPDVVDIAGGFAQKTLGKIKIPIEKVRLVFNQVPDKLPYSLQSAADKIGLPLFAEIPEDKLLRQPRVTESLFDNDIFKWKFGDAVYRLAENLLPDGSMTQNKIPWYKRLFSRKAKEVASV